MAEQRHNDALCERVLGFPGLARGRTRADTPFMECGGCWLAPPPRSSLRAQPKGRREGASVWEDLVRCGGRRERKDERGRKREEGRERKDGRGTRTGGRSLFTSARSAHLCAEHLAAT